MTRSAVEKRSRAASGKKYGLEQVSDSLEVARDQVQSRHHPAPSSGHHHHRHHQTHHDRSRQHCVEKRNPMPESFLDEASIEAQPVQRQTIASPNQKSRIRVWDRKKRDWLVLLVRLTGALTFAFLVMDTDFVQSLFGSTSSRPDTISITQTTSTTSASDSTTTTSTTTSSTTTTSTTSTTKNLTYPECLQNYWPVKDKAVNDMIRRQACQASTESPFFVPGRNNDPEGAIRVNSPKNYWTLPGVDYFPGDFTLTMWTREIRCNTASPHSETTYQALLIKSIIITHNDHVSSLLNYFR
jgi:hypothetical protein